MRTIIALLLWLPIASSAQHTVLLKDGEMLKGEVIRLDKGTLIMMHNGAPRNLRVEDVRTIQFFIDSGSEVTSASTGRKSFSGPNGAVAYTMDGRDMIKFPKITLGTNDQGTVVVDVMIDRYGNVKIAEPGAPGTRTSNDTYLFPKAKLACQEAKFNSDPKAPLETRGQVFVEFR
jgi:hypothetical protein